ncbi:MAG: hypothetical protein DHS20C14_00990 [Phycisphaeraceae bacterium]|nr:MAG: hypothetical protein DHS20C14_00990 [Phycisphaeraceae bacterium]
MRIALVNCDPLTEPDIDEAPLLGALREAGHDARTPAWNDPEADPGAFDVAVLRATWDYHDQPDAFVAWCERAAGVTRLLNAPDVVRWNIHKGYLLELGRAGVPIVPTELVERGDARTLGDVLARCGWDDAVIKPAVGAGSAGAMRVHAGDPAAGEAHWRTWLAGRDMLVQPFLKRVEHGGERALVWIDGELTHAIEKAPRFHDGEESVKARDAISSEERTLAAMSLGAAPKGLLYARVDVMELDDGSLALSELELIEPSLFFPYSGEAVRRMVAAIGRVV